MAKKKNRLDEIPPAAADAAPPAAAAAKPTPATPPAMTYVEVHRCPRCDSIAEPGAVTNTPWLDTFYNWRRTVTLLCGHCNRATVVELAYNGAGAWRQQEAARDVSNVEAAKIATDLARREEKRLKEAGIE
jgi:phage terminase large subunit GpA-like protein